MYYYFRIKDLVNLKRFTKIYLEKNEIRQKILDFPLINIFYILIKK